jgi:hypothetical protein
MGAVLFTRDADPVVLPVRVRVYRNLNATSGMPGERVFSVQDAATRRVVAHVSRIRLVDVRFIVSLAGQARVRREHRKNVHAFVEGTPVPWVEVGEAAVGRMVRYDPYVLDGFVDALSDVPVVSATVVWIGPVGVRVNG